MNEFGRQEIIRILASHYLLHGRFVFTSGGTGEWYVDVRKAALDPECAFLLGGWLRQQAERAGAQSIGGPETGAIPLVCAATTSYLASPYRGFWIRKTPRLHGTGNVMEGHFRASDKVLLIDDVATTFTSLRAAMGKMARADGRIVKVATIVTHFDTRTADLDGYPFEAACTLNELIRAKEKTDGP